MNIDKIKKKYSKQWVLIQYSEIDDNLQVKKGRVVAHSPKKEEIFKILGKTRGKNIAIEYTGPVHGDLTVMFFLSQ